MRRPEGPHAVAFGRKDLKIDNMSKSWGRIVVPKASIDGVVGGVPLGCLENFGLQQFPRSIRVGGNPCGSEHLASFAIQSLSVKGYGSNNTSSCAALPRMAISRCGLMSCMFPKSIKSSLRP